MRKGLLDRPRPGLVEVEIVDADGAQDAERGGEVGGADNGVELARDREGEEPHRILVVSMKTNPGETVRRRLRATM